jgi:hypothetical protein
MIRISIWNESMNPLRFHFTQKNELMLFVLASVRSYAASGPVPGAGKPALRLSGSRHILEVEFNTAATSDAREKML